MEERDMPVFCVGGACRDLLCGREVYDLDLEVYNSSLEQLEETLKKFVKTCTVGNRFLVVKTQKLNIDWALARLDGEGRLPEVKAIVNKVLPLKELYKTAAQRRDLTINSIGLNLTNMPKNFEKLLKMAQGKQEISWIEEFDIVDPFNGVKDIQEKRLKAVDKDFFVQDPLRLFRVAQFYSRLNFKPDQELTDICKTMPIELVKVEDKYFCPYERIGEELFKILRSTKPSLGLIWLMSLGRWIELIKGLEFFVGQEKLFSQTLTKLDRLAELGEGTLIELGQAKLTTSEKLFYALSIIVTNAPDPEKFLRSARVDKQAIAKLIKILKQEKTLLSIIEEKDFSLKLKLLAKSCWPEVKLKELFLYHAFNMDGEFFPTLIKLFNTGQTLEILDHPINAIVDGNDALEVGITGQGVKKFLEDAYIIQINESITKKSVLLERLNNLK